MHDEPPEPRGSDRQRSISRWVFVAFAAIAAYYLVTEHRAHLYGALPFLLLAACPLLHVFHHRGHGHEHGDGGDGHPDDGHRH